MAADRSQRVAEEIRLIVAEILIRQDIKDPRVRDAGLITITHVKVTGDLRQATVHFIVHGRDAAALKQVAEGLNHAAGFVRRKVGERLSMKSTPGVAFAVDKVFETEARVDEVLAEIEAARRATTPSGPEPEDPEADPKV